MPDNWSFVIAAYLLAAVVLGAYWRHLVKKERELESHERMDRPVKRTQSMGGHVDQSVKATPENPSVKGTLNQSEKATPVNQSVKGTPVNQSTKGTPVNQSVKGTEPRVPGAGHLRSEPSSRPPLQ